MRPSTTLTGKDLVRCNRAFYFSECEWCAFAFPHKPLEERKESKPCPHVTKSLPVHDTPLPKVEIKNFADCNLAEAYEDFINKSANGND